VGAHHQGGTHQGRVRASHKSTDCARGRFAGCNEEGSEQRCAWAPSGVRAGVDLGLPPDAIASMKTRGVC
jgi:hypothetical protein